MINKNKIPQITRIYADNGEHSHFKLVDTETGKTLWEETEETKYEIPDSSECIGFDNGKCFKDDSFCRGKCNYFKYKYTGINEGE